MEKPWSYRMTLDQVVLIILGIIGSNFLWFLAGMWLYKNFGNSVKVEGEKE